MIVRVPDIPNEGLKLSFDLDAKKLAERLNISPFPAVDQNISLPLYRFEKDLPVKIELNSDGRTVEMKGDVSVSYVTLCARCSSAADEKFNVPLQIYIKPKVSKDDEEDVDYALYEGEDLDCSAVIEDIVVSKMPFSSICSSNCKGLCAICGANLNQKACNCVLKGESQEIASEGPFAKLKDFKIVN